MTITMMRTHMNHDEVGAYAAERYLLDEMPEPERDAFEGHYFDCMVCANDVRSAYALRDSVRAVARCENEVAAHRAARGWRRFTAPLAAAASVAVALMGWTQFVLRPSYVAQIAEARKPYVAAEYRLESLRNDSRVTFSSASGTRLAVEIPTDAGPAPYTCRIVDAQGRTHGDVFTVSADQAQGDFAIVVPPGGLQPGEYLLRVSDANGKVITDHPFTVR